MASGLTTRGPYRFGGAFGKLMLVVFGLTVGFLAGAYFTAYSIYVEAQRSARSPQNLPARLTVMIDKRLDLTNEQAQEVNRILRKRMYVDAYESNEVFRGFIRENINKLESDVAEVLTDEQRAEWNALFEKVRESWLPPELGGAAQPEAP